jgi:hypothetical protein
MRRSNVVLAMAASLLSAGVVWGEEPRSSEREPTLAELKRENERLHKQVEQLAEQLEGTARPVNLGRTSLAEVSASSVNGGRGPDNPYYGVLNAFDDGVHWVNQINYTHWLSSGESAPWIEVSLSTPVTIAEVLVVGKPPFSVQAIAAKGGEETWLSKDGTARPATPAHGISRVRLTFQTHGGNAEIFEVKVMGYPPPGAKYEVGKPRLAVTRSTALATALEAFEAWKNRLMEKAEPLVTENEKAIEVVYRQGDLVLLRVRISKEKRIPEVEPLAVLRSLSP